MLIFKTFESFKNLKYGISEKNDGSMSLSETKNRRIFFESRGLSGNQTVSAKQTHSDLVLNVTQKDIGSFSLTADSLITYSLNLFLTVTVADCFPIYFYNPKTNQVALAHSGWQGTVKNIAGKTAGKMSGDPADILAGIGPGIQKCHFEIKKDILKEFAGFPETVIRTPEKIFVDLPAIITSQLQRAGIKSIESYGECTYCKAEKYFSHRREKSVTVKPMLAFIGLGV